MFSNKTIQDAWGKWADVDMLKQQQETSQSIGSVVNELWYTEWQNLTSAELQKAISGEVTAEQALKTSADFIRGKKK